MTTLASQKKLRQELESERRALRLDVALTTITALGLAVGVTLQIVRASEGAILIAFAVAFLAGGVPAGLSALRELTKGRLDIDLLMVLAALAAAAVGEARDGAILLFLFSLAGTLESYAMGNTKRAVAALMDLRPDTANLRISDQGELKEVGVDTLEIGDIVIVRPGERVPVDGAIVGGESALDQSPVTGESVPVDKGIGDPVFSGTVNGHGVLDVRVTKRADESTLARMIQLVTEAQEQRSPSERFSAWFGQRYTVFVLIGSLVALGAFLLLGLPRPDAFYKAATLLVVASPCAIVISVPAAVLSALAAAARQGVLFKGGAALEDFGRASIIAFDKTGTLTEGKMRVSRIEGVAASADEVLALAAALEAQSEHPVAQAIVTHAQRATRARGGGVDGERADEVQALPGRGLTASLGGSAVWAGNRKLAAELGVTLDARAEAVVAAFEATGNSVVIVGREGAGVLGVIGIADTVRQSARATLSGLREIGLERAVMLTGDHAEVALAVARGLGLSPDDVHADLLPEDKMRLVRELGEGGVVAFVGDGVNDAAALAAAGVGIAMGTAGSDVALETADVALLSDDLGRLPEAFLLARRANRIIRQNLTFALGIMVVMVGLTLFWHLPLPLGVLGHEGGTLIVVANGLRMLVPRRGAAAGADAGPQATERGADAPS